MNTPTPITPLTVVTPSASAQTTATGAAIVLGYGAAVLANKYHVPVEVTGAALGGLFTGLTALWHRLVAKIG